jgi:GAF domain-containing protein
MPEIPAEPRGLSRRDLKAIAPVPKAPAATPIDEAARVLEVARQVLEMDFAYLAEFKGEEAIYRAIAGDGASFDMTKGDGYPLDGTYDQRVVAGTIPNIINDTAKNEELSELAVTKLSAIGAYVGVPVFLKNRKLYGTFAAISHDPQPDLEERHLRLMEVLGQIVASSMEQQRLERDNARLRAQIGRMTVELDEAEEDRRMSGILTSGEFLAVKHGVLPEE